MSNSGSVKRVANAKTSQPSPLQTTRHYFHPIPRRTSALGGQLRPPIRFRLRFPVVVRVVTFRIVRPLRQAKKDHPDLGVSLVRRIPVHLSRAVVLHYTGVRL